MAGRKVKDKKLVAIADKKQVSKVKIQPPKKSQATPKIEKQGGSGILTNTTPHSLHAIKTLPTGEIHLVFICPGGTQYFEDLSAVEIVPITGKKEKPFKISK